MTYIWPILHIPMKLIFTCFLVAIGFSTLAQNAPDSLVSPLKSMPYEQYKAYSNGIDINNLALIGDLYHYPSPAKVLALKKELALNKEQFTQINAINIELLRKMKEMGALIIKNEQTLDMLFRTKQVNDGSLIFYTNRYGLYQGELRNAMLQTYLKVQNILTPEQLKKYQQLQHP